MTDDDRLADYFARLETPDYRRTLPDACIECLSSVVHCRCVRWITGEACCPTCAHP